MSGHGALTVIYWASGILGAALFGLWVALHVARQRRRRRYESVRQDAGHWDRLKQILPGSAREMRPEDDPCITENPGNPQQGEERP